MVMIKDNIWLMEPGQHRVMMEGYKAVLLDSDLMAQMASYNGTEPGLYEIRNRVALIDFMGTISARDSFFSWLMGGAVLPALANQIKAAEVDPKIDAIVLRMDSPGGPPAGLAEFSNMLRGVTKPIVGFCDGIVASGAMWIASALDGLVVTKTASVGSIGVLAVVEDITEAAAAAGVKFTVLRAGKYKALGNRYEALTGEGEAVLQAEIDALYSVFIDEVATNLGQDPDDILEVADGKIFIGEQAVEAGLASEIGFLEDAVEMALNINPHNGGNQMGAKVIKTVEALQEAYPELCAELVVPVDNTEDMEQAVSVESTRLLGLVSAFFGEDQGKKFATIVDSSVTLEQYMSIAAAVKVETVTPAEPATPAATPAPDKTKDLEALTEAAPAPVGAAPDQDVGPKTFEAAWKLVKAELNCTTQKAMSVAAKRYPALHDKITKGGAK